MTKEVKTLLREKKCVIQNKYIKYTIFYKKILISIGQNLIEFPPTEYYKKIWVLDKVAVHFVTFQHNYPSSQAKRY